ncbi:hypothetical protein SUGI_0139550 [Cryptomeria japonica]|uniref:protein DMP4 n=1 Tax=Cryptomeria japonica TaxID=3369 RepID=UPI0024089478|nr:protein DMP4 [Cryptomeria japonica]GLJ10984.1 hypothetical protein SUGI_0139550 [Cryptomeria japonica]
METQMGAEKMGLLEQGMTEEGRKSMIEKLLRQTFASTAHLANLLPTGTLLAFQVLVPIFSNDGQCDMISRFMTESLVFLCGISCFLACFTDSFRGSDGKIYYGIATPKGLWTFEYVSNHDDLAEEEDGKYQLRFLDFIHAVLSALVFFAFALLDDKVVSCLYPSPPEEAAELLDVVPIGIAVISSLLFVVFPTTRHGIGYPVSPI